MLQILTEVAARAYDGPTLAAGVDALGLVEPEDWPRTRARPIRRRGPAIVWPEGWDDRA